MGIGVYCQPVLQISAQTWNFWVLEALCSVAVIAAQVEEVIDLIVG